jgi:hypothetical protein
MNQDGVQWQTPVVTSFTNAGNLFTICSMDLAPQRLLVANFTYRDQMSTQIRFKASDAV